MINGTTQFRYEADNRAGICCPPKPVGFAPVFDAFGVMCLKQAADTALASAHADYKTVPLPSTLPVIFMDELGVMEAAAEFFFRTVCTLFSNPQYYIIGAVKPHGTRFLPVLEQIPEATVFHLTPQNRPQLYAQLEQAQSFTSFLHAVSGGSPNGKK